MIDRRGLHAEKGRHGREVVRVGLGERFTAVGDLVVAALARLDGSGIARRLKDTDTWAGLGLLDHARWGGAKRAGWERGCWTLFRNPRRGRYRGAPVSGLGGLEKPPRLCHLDELLQLRLGEWFAEPFLESLTEGRAGLFAVEPRQQKIFLFPQGEGIARAEVLDGVLSSLPILQGAQQQVGAAGQLDGSAVQHDRLPIGLQRVFETRHTARSSIGRHAVCARPIGRNPHRSNESAKKDGIRWEVVVELRVEGPSPVAPAG